MPGIELAGSAIPSHVDPALVRDWPLKATSTLLDPYKEIIPRIHAEWPEAVYALGGHSKGGDVWIFRRAEAFREIYIRSELFTAKQQTLMSRLIGEDWDMLPNEIDQPEHFFYRSILNPRFTPRAMAAMHDKVQQAASHYLDKIQAKKEADFVSEFTLRFPIAIFLSLVDFPLDKVEYYLKLEFDIIASPDLAVKANAFGTVCRILKDVIAERRARPSDDLFSYLLQAEYRGRKLTDDEVMRTGATLYLGGLDTVAQVMGWSIRHLAQNQDQQRLLRENPELVPGALEELIRAYAVATTSRRVTQDVEFRGVKLAQGDFISLPTFLAARDPAEYGDPNRIDFDRVNKRNVTFGTGAHSCLGVHLARRELLVAMQQVLRRFPNLRFADGEDATWHFGPVLGLDKMVLTWDH